jgi:hypothetical protein
MGDHTHHEPDAATPESQGRVNPAGEPRGLRDSLSRRAFLRWTAVTAGAAAFLGRLVGFVPAAQAQACTTYNAICTFSCIGPCNNTYSSCNTDVETTAYCVCSAGPGQCGNFMVVASCPDVFQTTVCCFSC